MPCGHHQILRGLLVGIAVELQIPREHRGDVVGDLDEVAAEVVGEHHQIQAGHQAT